MNSWKHSPSARLLCGVVALCLALAISTSPLEAQSTFPQYDHVFLIVMENEGYGQVVGNQFAPILNALANDYGLATNYTGVADPSEPNYARHARRRLLRYQLRRPVLVPWAHHKRRQPDVPA